MIAFKNFALRRGESAAFDQDIAQFTATAPLFRERTLELRLGDALGRLQQLAEPCTFAGSQH